MPGVPACGLMLGGVAPHAATSPSASRHRGPPHRELPRGLDTASGDPFHTHSNPLGLLLAGAMRWGSEPSPKVPLRRTSPVKPLSVRGFHQEAGTSRRGPPLPGGLRGLSPMPRCVSTSPVRCAAPRGVWRGPLYDSARHSARPPATARPPSQTLCHHASAAGSGSATGWGLESPATRVTGTGGICGRLGAAHRLHERHGERPPPVAVCGRDRRRVPPFSGRYAPAPRHASGGARGPRGRTRP